MATQPPITEKRTQHYVPQFYLRNFAFNNSDNAISMYRQPDSKYVMQVAIDGQGQEDYYYGEDGIVEEELQKLETKLAPYIARIITTSKCPNHNSEAYRKLLSFVLLSDLRNPIRKTLFEQIWENAAKPFKTNEVFTAWANEAKKTEKFVLQGLKMIERAFLLSADLKFKLLINQNHRPLITSDNPVVRYNQLFEHYKHEMPSGYATTGLQLIIPLSPKHAIIFFDEQVYYVGKKRQKEILLKAEEVDQLNALQFINSSRTVFGNHEATKEYFEELNTIASKYPKAHRLKVTEKGEVEEQGGMLQLQFQDDIRINLHFSFMALSNFGSIIKLSPTKSHIRKAPGILLELEAQKKIRLENFR